MSTSANFVNFILAEYTPFAKNSKVKYFEEEQVETNYIILIVKNKNENLLT